MKSHEILESLSKLDPDNDEHWNQDGQPRLSAIGEGVSRHEVQAVAPQFNRNSADLPEVEAPASLEEQLLSIEEQRVKAAADLTAAQEMANEAMKAAKEAQQRMEDLRVEAKQLDPRTPAEANRDLLRASFNERLRKAGEHQQAREMLLKAGLYQEVKTLTQSPIDQAIAARVVAERRKKTSPR